jgi:hypothetical protein
MDRVFKDLEKKGKPASGETTTAPAPEPPKPDETTTERPGEGTQTAPAETPGAPAEGQPTPEDKGKGGKGVSPWKLVDQFKARAATLEKELADVKGAITPENDRRLLTERAQKAETRLQELENEIRHVRYESSTEFNEKYEQPYQKAWTTAMQELRGVPVTDSATGEQRQATAEDMLALVKLETGPARDLAEEMFGKFAGDAMDQRKEIRRMFQAKADALESAKKEGSLREQQQKELTERQATEQAKFIKTTWDRLNAEALEQKEFAPFFKPREGDTEWNAALERGFKLVDQAFSGSVSDPKLSPEQRAAMIRKHVAVRNRAASWGALKRENDSVKAKLAAIEKELAQYKSSTPPAGGSQPAAPNGELKGMERVRADLLKFAH